MKEITRLTFEIPTHILPAVDRVAAERGVSRTTLLRQGLGVIQTMHEAAKDGFHAGLVRDKRKLDTLLVSPI
jgi:hypothetical protein